MKNQKTVSRPIKVIQFGEGGFLRGFADWMLQKLNDINEFNGNVVVVQPIEQGMCDALSEQNCLYTHIIRGSEGVEITKVDVISSCVKPYENFEEYLKLADIPEARFIISNTTEAGITFSADDKITDTPPATFPAKLTLLMKRRFDNNLKGFILLPCELIDHNGDNLKRTVLQYAELWNLGDDFKNWIENENIFCNTLVDRINTGYPRDEKIELGYTDNLINTSEYFHLWVIETDYDLESEIPFSKANLNVIITKDALECYHTRKVRILNGAHTSMVAYALLSGFDTVKSCMDDEKMYSFVKSCLFDEIIPTLNMDRDELTEYAENVLIRFKNPYIKHYLSSIALNSVSKFRVRVLPSILEYKKIFGKYPKNLMFSFKKLIEFYKEGTPNDSEDVIKFIKESSIAEILKNETLWGTDLSDMLGEF
ncbi:MAG: tagaturonate reductase [Acutalibacteraceae bacterium]|nr:tagaturonate reductase [Acutalibacteraceae bacterium]